MTIALRDISNCFEGAIPAVVATASATGVPNVTYLSRVQLVDDERVALSNQFFSKTVRNLAENPRASLLLIDPITYDQYRLTLVYERTDRRGAVFERLRHEVDVLAALEGMQDVFKLRAADIYRVVDVEQVPSARVRAHASGESSARVQGSAGNASAIAALTARMSRCPDLNTLVSTTVEGLAEVFGYEHSLLLLLDESGTMLYTIASHGYDAEGVGSEVAVGDGIIGLAAEQCAPITLGGVHHLARYSRRVRRSFEDSGDIGPGRNIPLPGLQRVASAVVVPAMVLGELVGVLMVESEAAIAFGTGDEAQLMVVASLVANAIEVERARERATEVKPNASTRSRAAPSPPAPGASPTHVRFFAVDGSTFIGGDYLIKGVAGRLLWSLLGHYDRDGRTDFTNREVRLDATLELPEFRDNFESRLILLKRRLDERAAPIRIEKTGRGRFRLIVDTPLKLEPVGV